MGGLRIFPSPTALPAHPPHDAPPSYFISFFACPSLVTGCGVSAPIHIVFAPLHCCPRHGDCAGHDQESGECIERDVMLIMRTFCVEIMTTTSHHPRNTSVNGIMQLPPPPV